MKIKPLHDRVVVRRLPAEERTAGGLILIPESAKEKPLAGEVLAVGTGKRLKSGAIQPLDISVGDRVIFGKYAGTEIKVDGEDLLLLREDDLIGVSE